MNPEATPGQRRIRLSVEFVLGLVIGASFFLIDYTQLKTILSAENIGFLLAITTGVYTAYQEHRHHMKFGSIGYTIKVKEWDKKKS